jgi:hypothetical protein
LGGFVVHNNLDARWGNGGAIEIELAMDLGPGGEVRIYSGTSEEVEGKDGLRE